MMFVTHHTTHSVAKQWRTTRNSRGLEAEALQKYTSQNTRKQASRQVLEVTCNHNSEITEYEVTGWFTVIYFFFQVALKVIKKKNLSDEKVCEKLFREIDNLEVLQHENIVEYYDSKFNCKILSL